MEPSNLNRQNSIFSRWISFAPYFLSALRIVAAAMFMMAGTMKLWGFPIGMPPHGSTATMLTQVWFGGVLEVFGGALILIGLCTRPVAFILAGEMAVAYFQVHAPQSIWPVVNNGVAAVLYCFIWLYFSAAGSGLLSLDSLLSQKRK